jgi:hypothetical protein
MKFGQFCGFLADEMDLQHSDFILGAELLFTTGVSESSAEMAVSFPDRNVTPSDAAMLVCLLVAMDLGAADPSQGAETAQDIAALGQNIPVLLAAMDEQKDATLDVGGRFSAKATVPASLTSKISPLIRSRHSHHLRSV